MLEKCHTRTTSIFHLLGKGLGHGSEGTPYKERRSKFYTRKFNLWFAEPSDRNLAWAVTPGYWARFAQRVQHSVSVSCPPFQQFAASVQTSERVRRHSNTTLLDSIMCQAQQKWQMAQQTDTNGYLGKTSDTL